MLGETLMAAVLSLLPAERATAAEGTVLAAHGSARAVIVVAPDASAPEQHAARELAAFLRTQAAEDAVLYHYWLGSHYRFYLYDAALRLHWYPDLDDLARDAVIYRREPRYIAFPSWRDGRPATETLAGVGISLEPILETKRRDDSISFRLYRLQGP